MIATKAFLYKQFMINDLGYAKYFLGLEIFISTSGMFLNQQKYIKDILKNTEITTSQSNHHPEA